MGNKELICKALLKKSMTSSELSKTLSIELQGVRTCLFRLKTENKIENFDKKGREFLYRLVKSETKDRGELIELLKFVNDMFKNNFRYLKKNETIKKFIVKNKNKFSRIEELV